MIMIMMIKIMMSCVDTFIRIVHNMMLSQIFWPNGIHKQEAGENCIIRSYHINCLTAVTFIRIVKGKKARWAGNLARILRI